MTEPRYSWTHDPVNRRYVIWRGELEYARLPINRRHPANTISYVQRCVATLNGESK